LEVTVNQPFPDPVERVVTQLQRQGRKVERHGDSWSAQCPAHDDQRSSLSIRAGRQGQALLNCHAGCAWREIAGALGLEVEALFPTGRPAPRSASQPACIEYSYREPAGAVVYQVVRTPQKQFWVRRPAGAGGWEKGLGTAVRLPYRLPELLAAADRLVFVVEGEKDVETLRAHGLIASTNLGGAGKWRDDYSPYFQGRQVVVLPDNDAPGQAHAEAVVASLRAVGVEAALLALPGLPAKGDVSDWLQAGGQPAQLETMARHALDAAREPGAERLGLTPEISDKSAQSDESPARVPALRSLSAPLPAPLAPEAYHGIAGEIVRAIEPHTEAHPAALLVTLLTALGNLIGSGPHARVGPTRHRLKLFAVIFGPTAKGRKGTSEDHVRALLREVDPEWEQLRLLSGTSSGEGIIHHVRDAVEGEERDPKSHAAPRIVRDPGVSDKRLLIIESEFAQLLKVMSREGNTVSPIVRLAWDDKPLQNSTKNSPAIATGSHISLLGHSTQEELLRYLTQTEAANGFGNRFLWVWAMRSKALPFPSEAPGLEALAGRLRVIVESAQGIGAVSWGAATRPLWAEIYAPLSEGRTGLFGAVTSRAEAQVLRLATLYAVLDASAAIEPPHLLAGLAVWRYCEASARYLFGDATGDPVADAILEKVRQCPAGVDRTAIRDLLQRHCSGERLNRVLDRLVVEGLLRREKRTDTGGRPAELLLPTEATLLGGDNPLAIARRLAAELSRAGAESDQSTVSVVSDEAPSGVPALGSLSALAAATTPPPLDPNRAPADTEDELVSPDERLRAFDLDLAPVDAAAEELALDLGPEDDDPEEDDRATAVPGDGARRLHVEL
jgi:hypothetical protein